MQSWIKPRSSARGRATTSGAQPSTRWVAICFLTPNGLADSVTACSASRVLPFPNRKRRSLMPQSTT
eukprot:1954765-Pyramimonas_sp.AAC.1